MEVFAKFYGKLTLFLDQFFADEYIKNWIDHGPATILGHWATFKGNIFRRAALEKEKAHADSEEVTRATRMSQTNVYSCNPANVFPGQQRNLL